MVKKTKKVYIRRRIIFSFMPIMFIAAIICIVSFSTKIKSKEEPVNKSFAAQMNLKAEPEVTSIVPAPESVQSIEMIYPRITDTTGAFDASLVTSENGVLIDVENNTILAQRNCDARIYPASLTKIMTLIVAVENINDLNKTFTMTSEILNPLVNAGATRAGFEVGEPIKLVDMLYGAILPSGADATIGLAESISGTEADFVTLMNAKVQSLGLKNTHFVNTSGLHDENHYSTPVDMAMILEYAMQNDLCRQILSTYQYTTGITTQHPQGILLESTMFSRMYGTEAENVTILGGKMGYTDEAGNCLASFATKNGKEYIAVTTKGAGKYAPIFDSINIYGNYLA